MYEPAKDITGILTQALEPSMPQDHIIILFDTDAFRDVRVPVDFAQTLRGYFRTCIA